MRITYLIVFVLLGGIANMKGYPGEVAAVLLVWGAVMFDRRGRNRIVDAAWDVSEWARWRLSGGR